MDDLLPLLVARNGLGDAMFRACRRRRLLVPVKGAGWGGELIFPSLPAVEICSPENRWLLKSQRCPHLLTFSPAAYLPAIQILHSSFEIAPVAIQIVKSRLEAFFMPILQSYCIVWELVGGLMNSPSPILNRPRYTFFALSCYLFLARTNEF